MNNIEKMDVFLERKIKVGESYLKKNKACFYCGKNGHFKRDRQLLKKIKKSVNKRVNQVDELDEIIVMVTNLKIDMVTEVHMATTTKSNNW